MPNLTLTVTTAQANRIATALTARYAGTSLASAPLADQARDFLMVALRQLVRDYERALAVKQAEDTVIGL